MAVLSWCLDSPAWHVQARAFASWADAASWRSTKRQALKQVVTTLQHGCLARALAAWRAHAGELHTVLCTAIAGCSHCWVCMHLWCCCRLAAPAAIHLLS